ncbi:MAG TPA: aminoacyl-tRNA hydrolase [Polyangiaceae bacterium]|jgi:PTH1 family peptidyl-tRNA hydrolase|nr:aminoacyl-tRNA hydrolase [Polyangiaceae bacterium]
MQLVVGLGNPGARYSATRHNIGFVVLERLAQARGGQWREQFESGTADVSISGERVLLQKPQTFMNLSGFSVVKAANFFKIPAKDVIVVHDEVDLPLGDVRLKRGGGEAGHNGLRSISEQLGTQDYVRLRCGVGRPPPEFRGDLADFVLQAFPPEQGPQVESLVEGAIKALEMLFKLGLEQAMNQANRRPKT